MAKSYRQKMKLLYLMELFLEETDENHTVSMKDMIAYLEKHQLKAERKSIYDDIEALKAFGMDIKYRRQQPAGYYLANRCFSTEECKLLADAVQSYKYVTGRKSKELVRKIQKLCSRWHSKGLERQMIVSGRIKSMNETIYENLDLLEKAMHQEHKISFRYLPWKSDEKMLVQKKRDAHIASPWAISWTEGEYYLTGYDSGNQRFEHYRLDRMTYIKILKEGREGYEEFQKFDIEQL